MKNKQLRVKMHPFRILVMLWNGSYGWLEGDGLDVQVGPRGLARTLRVSNDRVRDYFLWMAKFGYVENVRFERGKIFARLVQPKRLVASLRDQPAMPQMA